MSKDERKKRKVRVDQKCDYCDQKLKYIGATDFSGKIHKVCENHKENAMQAMGKDKDENNKVKL